MSFWQWLKMFGSRTWSFLVPFIKMFLSELGPVLAVAATRAVTVVAEDLADAPGSVKRDAAFRMIADDLKRRGIVLGVNVTTSAINAAIEAAVQALKAK